MIAPHTAVKAMVVIYGFILMMADCKYDNTVAARNIQVPDHTETGANTFGATINNKVWLNFGKYRHGTELGVQYEDNVLQKNITVNYPPPITDTLFNLSGQLSVLEKGTAIREETLGISLKKPRGATSFVGQYQLGGAFKPAASLPLVSSMIYSDHIPWISYISLDRNPATLIVKKDVIAGGKHIISGIFQGYLYNTGNITDSIKVVGGEFDVDILH